MTESDYRDMLRASVLESATFLRLTMSGKRKGSDLQWQKAVVRPVLVQGQPRMQFSWFDGRRDITENWAGPHLEQKLDEALALPFRQFHLQATSGDLYVRVTRKSKALIDRTPPSLSERPPIAHDRVKGHVLPRGTPDILLQALGIMDASGRVRPPAQGKFRQVNEFLRIVSQVVDEADRSERPLEIVDFGCGRAYLTFAAYHYLHHIQGRPVRVIGIDRDPELVTKCDGLRDELGWADLSFRTAAISDLVLERPPDLVLSLHACNTATDEALAQGILQDSRIILAAPCCQHELRPQLRAPLFQPVLRHGVLKQRTAEILTDALRALTLRIMGYRTSVIEFVDPEHTARNLLIRAQRGVPAGDPDLVREYRELRDFWQVTPTLEGLLGSTFGQHVG